MTKKIPKTIKSRTTTLVMEMRFARCGRAERSISNHVGALYPPIIRTRPIASIVDTNATLGCLKSGTTLPVRRKKRSSELKATINVP
jgi:hypothetical protein